MTRIKLLYHTPGERGQVSPFDRDALRIVAGQAASFASPYVTLRFFQRLADRAQSWRLITDVVECLGAQPKAERRALAEFLYDRRKQVRDVAGLHAKVILTEDELVVGSANLTSTGYTKRAEMSAVIRERKLIAEAQAWYESTWLDGAAPDLLTMQRACDAPEPDRGSGMEGSRPSSTSAMLDDEAPLSLEAFLETLKDLLHKVGFWVARDRWGTTLRVRPAQKVDPLLNPRPVGGKLVVTVSALQPGPDKRNSLNRKLGAFPDDEFVWFEPIRRLEGKIYYYGDFVMPREIDVSPLGLESGLDYLRAPWSRILQFLTSR